MRLSAKQYLLIWALVCIPVSVAAASFHEEFKQSNLFASVWSIGAFGLVFGGLGACMDLWDEKHVINRPLSLLGRRVIGGLLGSLTAFLGAEWLGFDFTKRVLAMIFLSCFGYYLWEWLKKNLPSIFDRGGAVVGKKETAREDGDV